MVCIQSLGVIVYHFIQLYVCMYTYVCICMLYLSCEQEDSGPLAVS